MTAKKLVEQNASTISPSEDVVAQLRKQGDYDRVMLHITRQMIWDGVANSALFRDAVQSIAGESKPADFFLEVIHIALEIEGGLLARDLATQGHQRFPNDAELSKVAHLLAPPNFVNSTPPKPSLSSTMRWFRENSTQYHDYWVAVQNGRLIGADKDYQQLIESIGDAANDAETVITRVP